MGDLYPEALLVGIFGVERVEGSFVPGRSLQGRNDTQRLMINDVFLLSR